MKKKKDVRIFFNDKRLLAMTIALFFIFAFALNFVGVGDMSVTGAATMTGASTTGDVDELRAELKGESSVFDKLTNVLMGDKGIDQAFIRWTFFIILTMLIFSALSVIGWPKSRLLNWLLAMPIAFVSISMINTADFAASMINYGALGLTMITALPLVVILLFSSQLLQGKVTIGKIFFQLIMWYYYLAFSIYLIGKFLYEKEGGFHPFTLDWWEKSIIAGGIPVIIITIPVFVSFIVIIYNKRFRKWIRKLGRELKEELGADIGAARKSEEKGVE